MQVAIITASDRSAHGKRDDLSGQVVRQIVEDFGYQVVSSRILEDDQTRLRDAMKTLCESGEVNLILTTGGTGFSQRDVTPEATLEVVTRLAPGIPEAMRAYSMQFTKRAMLSRGVAGICQETLIVNLPGSPKAVEECLTYILPELHHGLEILMGTTSNCGRK